MAVSTFHPQHHPLYPERQLPARASEAAPRWREIRAAALFEDRAQEQLWAPAPGRTRPARIRGGRATAGVDERPLLIYGATGRTGRALAEHLADAGAPLLLAGRDAPTLDALAAALPGTRTVRVAAAAADELRAAMAGCAAAIQCAALPEIEAHAFVDAALQTGLHYVDVAAERDKVEALARRHGDEARRRGLALCSGVAPIGGALGEWLGLAAAHRALAGRDGAALGSLTIAYASDALPPSRGSWSSSLSMVGRRPAGGWGLRNLDFPPPFGRLPAFAFALGGAAALEARYAAAEHRCYAAFRLDPGTLGRPPVPRLAALAEARAGSSRRAVAFSGAAPYEITARMVALAVGALVRGEARGGGVVRASELVPPAQGLAALEDRCGRLYVRES